MALESTQASLQRSSLGDGARSDSQKLGDFAKLQSLSSLLPTSSKKGSTSSSTLGFMTPPASRSSGISDKPVTLGDFSRLFDKLATSAPVSPSPPTVQRFSGKAAKVEILKRPTTPQTISTPPSTQKQLGATSSLKSHPSLSSDTGSASESESEFHSQYSTPLSSPSSSASKESSPLANFSKRKSKSSSPKSTKAVTATTQQLTVTPPKPSGSSYPIISYQFYKHGPITTILDQVPTEKAKHNALVHKLVPERVTDKILRLENPNLESNGVHVFLDMSNISISFQKALRSRYSLSDSVRFTPLPSMNLSFFHELLVRGRDTKVLNAGCSMLPNRSEPMYIQDLRDLGYRVDLRYRRREGNQGPEETRGPSVHTRYVEDMVDETLQTRIGESVMRYFDAPGTLVLATGDARPAKFSDGFFSYAERALKMGWNVEVVSWKSSLSGAWTNRAWAEPWGDRFRVIELDSFIDDLFACYAPPDVSC